VPGGGGSRSGAHFWSTLLVKLMLHFVSFLMLASVVFAAVCSALAFMLRRQLQHKAIIWFSAVTAALGCFLLEILVYRYAHALKAALTTAEYDGIMTFSELWALCGGILMTAAMPRLARLMAGYPYHLGWKIADFGLPTAAFFAGVALLGPSAGAFRSSFCNACSLEAREARLSHLRSPDAAPRAADGAAPNAGCCSAWASGQYSFSP
jgi:hypothetical protein